MSNRDKLANAVSLRTELQPGDLGEIVRMHGVIYSQEHGFDPTFEAYVAGPLAAFVIRDAPRERLWIAERDSRLIGSIGIVEAGAETAQLRWFLVLPEARCQGLGSRLLREAVAFARTAGYREIMLWTASVLMAAARLYESAGFGLVTERREHVWGVDVMHQQYTRPLAAGHD
jgi:GNAT superfamily N-acetyltransferase